MKSLQKTFDLLEYVFLRNGSSVTPSEAADALGINLVTATRIMGSLVERGYLIKISRKDGYAPGPMVMALGSRHNAYERLTAAARQPVEDLSNQLNRQVNLSVLNGEKLADALSVSHGQAIRYLNVLETEHILLGNDKKRNRTFYFAELIELARGI